MFLFENVRGLLTHDKGKTYATMLEIFAKAGYTITKKVLNAWDYGAPQKRERLVTIYLSLFRPEVIRDVVNNSEARVPHDTVLEELRNIANLTGEADKDVAMAIAIYLLGFHSYYGFSGHIQRKGADENMLRRIYAYAKETDN